MATMTIQEAQAALPDVIRRLVPGDEVLITENGQPVAWLLPIPGARHAKPRQLGAMKGTVLYMAPDFDAPLEDFKEYME
jgi:prevent-host-death family protein